MVPRIKEEFSLQKREKVVKGEEGEEGVTEVNGPPEKKFSHKYRSS
jgi:hypothetical protein